MHNIIKLIIVESSTIELRFITVTEKQTQILLKILFFQTKERSVLK